MVYDPLTNQTAAADSTYDPLFNQGRDLPEPASAAPAPATWQKPLKAEKPGSPDSGAGLKTPFGDRQSIAPDSEGTLFGKYRVLHKLGDGGMGDVWLVEHIFLDLKRALKIIKAEIADENPSNRLRFQQEAKILAQLSKHPNAVEVHDFRIVGDHAYIEMDHLDGQTLGKWMKSKSSDQPPLDDVLWLLDELCNVLEEAHKLGIVHRDIKPGNIMIVPDPTTDRGERVKVLDFGIAKIVRQGGNEMDSLTMHTKGFLGTVPYSSPEQLGIDMDGKEHVRVDHRSDIYSIGVLLYEMLSGNRPFTGNPTKVLYDHCHTPPPPFAKRSPGVKVPAAIEKVVMRCLEKSPDKRPQSAHELFEMFRNAVPKTKPKPDPKPKPQRRRENSKGWRSEPQTELTKVDTSSIWSSHLPSFLTQIGLPRSLPRPAILRLFLSLTLVSGIVSGAVVLFFLPSIGTTPPDTSIPKSVRNYLKARGFRAADRAIADDSGWPEKIRRISTNASSPFPLVLRGQLYLPEGVEYAPKTDEGVNDDDLPIVLERKSDKTRFHLIEGGEFLMGAWDANNKDFNKEEKPGHLASLSHYYMQETEVTNKEIQVFSKELGIDHSDLAMFWAARSKLLDRYEEDAWEKHPAVGISRKLAENYAHHVGGELPSEQQWEFAARSRGKKRLYVWPGNKVRDNDAKDESFKAHISSNTFDNRFDTRSVRQPAYYLSDCTEQGIHGLAGNVREWCRDVWRYYGGDYPPDHVELPREGETNRYVIRGGSFKTPPETVRVTWRTDIEGSNASPYKAEEDESFEDVGFRVVLEVVVKQSSKEIAAAP